MARSRSGKPIKDPQWYKNAIIYELHVRAFYDSNGDGIGDFEGLTQKLDYLSDLGVTAIWLLPFYPSPLKDDGYDIADYESINPIYGNLTDFKALLREAHERGLRVITELVLNHTSDQHPWFQRARRARPGSRERDFYVWSDTPEKYKDARIIFKDFEPSNWTWDRVAHAYYWHRFYSHQPDLNYDNPHVHKAMMRLLDFWFDMGVDGLRLDAVPYLYEREGTSCENLPETHAYLKKLRKHIDEKYGDRMLLAEANQWPEDAVSYFGSGTGDECHMAFHFPLMPRLFMAVRMEDRVPIVDILDQTPSIPANSQWALFLRNHDELTLEMVTDEERDYMYRVYASDSKARINLGIRRRLAPLLGNDRKRIELLNLLLFSLPGTPVLYYGDEIGMGDNVFLGDRNGVRTPMQWSADKNAGFSRTSPQALYLPIILDPEYHYEAVNVETQQRNPHSLLWWMKRVLTLRKRWKAFGNGTLEFLHPENRKVLAFIRRFENETLLVLANLSRFTQPVELDLAAFKDHVPVELFGRTRFPVIRDVPYFLTLSPHSAFWFSLESIKVAGVAETPVRPSDFVAFVETWEECFTEFGKARLEAGLPAYLRERRWFGGKTRDIKSVVVRDAIPVANDDVLEAYIAFVGVEYVQGDPETYLLPLAFATGPAAEQIQREMPHSVVARLQKTGTDIQGLLYDGSASRTFCRTILESIARRKGAKGELGELETSATRALHPWRVDKTPIPEPSVSRAEQSNTSIVFGDKFILKLYRKLESGINPDLEISRFLTERGFTHTPHMAGAIEYRLTSGDNYVLGILTHFVPNAKDAWTFTLDALGRYFDRVRTLAQIPRQDSAASLLELAQMEIPTETATIIGTYLESARLLGVRSAEMHLMLGSETNDPRFTPEAYTPFYQRSFYQSLRNLMMQNFQLLRRQLRTLPEDARVAAENVLAHQDELLRRFRAVHITPLDATRIRCHGDYHLGQVLYTGKDYLIIDFEGEPARSLSERSIKRSPFRDVAGMIRSFDYVTYAALLQQVELGHMHRDQVPSFLPWARFWYQWVSATFLRSYLEVIQRADLLPKSQQGLAVLFDACMLDKAIYEIGYELNNRPDWLRIPLEGILQLLQTPQPKPEVAGAQGAA